MEKTLPKKQKAREETVPVVKVQAYLGAFIEIAWDAWFKEYLESHRPIFTQFSSGAEAFKDYLMKGLPNSEEIL